MKKYQAAGSVETVCYICRINKFNRHWSLWNKMYEEQKTSSDYSKQVGVCIFRYVNANDNTAVASLKKHHVFRTELSSLELSKKTIPPSKQNDYSNI